MLTSENGSGICGVGKATESSELIAAELDKPGGGASSKLFSEFCEQMQECAGDQSGQVILQSIAMIDQKEKDGLGIDLAVKYGEEGQVQQAIFLGAELNLRAKEFAASMDQGDHKKAGELLARIMPTLSGDDSAKFLQAVDAYDVDGKGEDITIDYDKGSQSVSLSLGRLEIVND